MKWSSARGKSTAKAEDGTERFRRMTVLLTTGVLRMSIEAKETIREKLAQSRRLLQQSTDSATVERLRTYIDELERQLLLEMAAGPE
jgi:hypothetical protein